MPTARSFNLRGALLISVMLAALVAAIGGTIQRLFPGWQPLYLTLVCFLISLEAGIVHYAARSERMSFTDMLRYLAPEIFVMAMLMRLIASVGMAGASLGADLTRWLYDPLAVFDAAFGMHMLAGVLVGVMAHVSMRDLGILAPMAGEREAVDNDRRFIALVAVDRSMALKRIGSRFILGGGLLLLALAGETVDPDVLGATPRALATLSVVAALAYTLSGFVLYSRARLVLLRAKWEQEGAHIADMVERRWIRSSWLLIGVVVVLTALLPRAYALGLLDTIRVALGVVGYVLAMLGYVFTWLLALLLSLPAWLLSLLQPAGAPQPPRTTAPPPPPPPAMVERDPNLLAALVFWFCMLLLAGYAVSIVAQRHPDLVRRLQLNRLVAALVGWLRGIWRDTSAWTALASRVVSAAWRRPVAPVRPRSGFFVNLRRLAPRDLVRYFYRSTLRRAAERGMGRSPAQTPYEYAARLGGALPDIEPEIGELTEAFVAAQYAPRPVSPEDASRARRPWQRLRRALRAWRGKKA